MKNSSNTIGNQTRDLLACSAVPQPTASPRAPVTGTYRFNAKGIVWEAVEDAGPVWTGGKNLAPNRNSIRGPSSQHLVAVPTELSRSPALGTLIENRSVLPQRESQKICPTRIQTQVRLGHLVTVLTELSLVVR